MHLEELSNRVTQELDTALSDDLPKEEREVILDIVRRAMLDSAKRTHREMKDTAVVCCGHEADLAIRSKSRWRRNAACWSLT